MFDQQDFVQKAIRTESPNFVPSKHVTPAEFASLFQVLVQSASLLDTFKKLAFYNPKGEKLEKLSNNIALIQQNHQVLTKMGVAPEIDSEPNFHAVSPRVLHAAIGKITESVELLEPIMNTIYRGAPLDVTNIKEEFGDGMWYDAILCDELGFTYNSEGQRVTRKLEKRFPEKFTDEAAAERDLEAEREELEKDD